jgi:hypothetical protein
MTLQPCVFTDIILQHNHPEVRDMEVLFLNADMLNGLLGSDMSCNYFYQGVH